MHVEWKRILAAAFAVAGAVGWQAQAAEDVYAASRERWLAEAEAAKPALVETLFRPEGIVRPAADPAAFQGWRMEPVGGMERVCDKPLKSLGTVTVDFGRHLTGRLTLRLRPIRRVQDAPVRLRLTMAEVPAELATPFDPYPGTLSRAWLQDETVTVTDVTAPVEIGRRLAGRYLRIEVLGTSPDFDAAISGIEFRAVSAVGTGDGAPLPDGLAPGMRAIYEAGCRTLSECMQTVYEDGPKRDQRLWIGDLYLESLANACTFRRHDLTRRCLYLLAALAAPDGRLHANVFEHPEPHPQEGSFCLSYSLLYNLTLLEYVRATGDLATARELWPVARRQIVDALRYVGDDGIFDCHSQGGDIWIFFDWRAGFEESTAMQGLVIEALEKSCELARTLGCEEEAEGWLPAAARMKRAARQRLFDRGKGLFVSGPERQLSWLSQAWMIRAGVVTPEEGRRLFERLDATSEAIRPGSPYGNHFLLEALVACGLDERARAFLSDYWGGMVRKGADTFYEVWDPRDETLSPYGFHPVNSYCHAWSCTPVYFIVRYPEIFAR